MGPPPGLTMPAIRIAVVEEHEIFRLGVVAALATDPWIEIVLEADHGPAPDDAQLAVVSPRAAAEEPFGCPIVVSTVAPGALAVREGTRVIAKLSRTVLTADQLTATVRAAAAGLRVAVPEPERTSRLDSRSLQILRLLAGGADTTEISTTLRYSPRTIKTCIATIEQRLGARNRTHAVAEGIRRGLI